MDSIIQTFHIDWHLILAQILNFSVVVAVLWFFALKPLTQKMAERTQTIEKSLDEAKRIAQNMQQSEEDKAKTLQAARQEAQKIVESARVMAKQEQEKNLNETKALAQKIVTDGKRQMAAEKDAMMRELKGATGELAVMAAEKLLEKVMDKKIDQALVKKALEEMDQK